MTGVRRHVTDVTLFFVTDNVSWLLVLLQLPTDPSRHRVAVWRELRKGGAVPVSQGAWAIPDAPAFHPSLERAEELAHAGGGTFAVIEATPRSEAGLALIRDAFVSARLDEWNEFEADCGKYEAEIDNEVRKKKFTFGELEEEEQSLDRLRRWHRDLKKRDILALPEAEAAERRLRHCEDVLADYAEMVYETMRGNSPASAGTTDPDSAG
ncbi:Chromate resistance protein ChrB [Rathayibacter sp. KR2-224]|uniref:Chromate resistance protein ChrB n=1 Tax=Rathayibacter sp. KR2-224 TaxID=3400913 RepID=UPI003BFF6EAD